MISLLFYFPQIELTLHPSTKSLKYKGTSDQIDNSSNLHQVSIIWLIQIPYTIKETGDLWYNVLEEQSIYIRSLHCCLSGLDFLAI